MAKKLIPNTVSVAVVYDLHGHEVVNDLYVEKDSIASWTLEQLQLVGETIGNAIGLYAMAVSSVQLVCQRIVVTDESVVGGSQYVVPGTFVGGGVVTGDSLPGGSAFVAKFLTGRVGRSFRGRNYHGGIPESLASLGAVSTTYANGIMTMYATMATDLETAGEFRHCVVSRVQDNTILVVPQRYPVTSYAFTTLAVRSQRKRNNGIGV